MLKQGKKYDLVFTDLDQNPKGIEVYKEAASRGIESYIMSGGTMGPRISEEARRVAGDHYIDKPFELKRIMDIYAQARVKKAQTPPYSTPGTTPLPSTSSATAKGAVNKGGLPEDDPVLEGMTAQDALRRLRPTKLYDPAKLYQLQKPK